MSEKNKLIEVWSWTKKKECFVIKITFNYFENRFMFLYQSVFPLNMLGTFVHFFEIRAILYRENKNLNRNEIVHLMHPNA